MNKQSIFKGAKGAAAVVAFAAVAIVSQAANAGFVPYIIRGAATFDDTTNPGQIEFVTDVSGEKAGLGSSDIDGMTLGSITNLHIDRLDDISRFTAGSGPAVAPYLNFWITDGTNFAVVANEPSNPAFQPLYNNGYDLSFADLSDKVAKIYENSDMSWLPNAGVGLTFADLADFVIMAPTVSDLTTGWGGLGTGAPRELGTNAAYGVNWVFGDTLSNYVSGDEGYIVANARAAASAVPEPGTLGLLGIGILGLGMLRRRTR